MKRKAKGVLSSHAISQLTHSNERFWRGKGKEGAMCLRPFGASIEKSSCERRRIPLAMAKGWKWNARQAESSASQQQRASPRGNH